MERLRDVLSNTLSLGNGHSLVEHSFDSRLDGQTVDRFDGKSNRPAEDNEVSLKNAVPYSGPQSGPLSGELSTLVELQSTEPLEHFSTSLDASGSGEPVSDSFHQPPFIATDLETVWKQASAELAKRLDSQIFTAWIKPLGLASIDRAPVSGPNRLSTEALPAALFRGNVRATILTPNKFCCEHVSNNYGSIIVEVLSDILSVKSLELHFTVKATVTAKAAGKVAVNGTTNGIAASANTGASQPSASTGTFPLHATAAQQAVEQNSARLKPDQAVKSDGRATAKPMARRTSRSSMDSNSLNLNPKYNFSNFVVGTCNQFAHAVSQQVANELGSNYNPLFIYGGVGLGKTHLANAIGNASRRRNKKVLLASSESFLSELISSLRSNSMAQFKSKFRSLDVLVIDDIQFIIGKERTQEEFFHTFNDLYSRHKQIIITSDKVPQELVGLEERLRTRFASGIAVDLQKPDFETRVAILSKKAAASGFEIPAGVARLVAERIDTNVRELEGALNRLQAMAGLNNLPITEALADEVLRSLAPQRKKEVTTDLVKRVVAEKFNVSVHDIVGKRRTHNIALARQVAMFLCRELTTCSYPELGALFGGRDHSTVIHARKVVAERADKDENFKSELSTIQSSILT